MKKIINICAKMNTIYITRHSPDNYSQTLSYYLPAVPHAPTLAVAAKLYELQLNCSFGSDAIYCNVTIEINGNIMSATGNSTFYGLVNNTLYNISAKSINRCGDYSETRTSHWTCKVKFNNRIVTFGV